MRQPERLRNAVDEKARFARFMESDGQIVEATRHTRKTLYLVAGLYTVIGFLVATVSAVVGDRLGTFLGFIIISGALAVAALFRAALQLGTRVALVDQGVDDLRERLMRVEELMEGLAERDAAGRPSAPATSTLDLAAVGQGDPSVLAAATLDRTVYPRLATTMEEEPPAQSRAPRDNGSGGAAEGTDAVGEPDPVAGDGVPTRNLLRQWQVALREGDLPSCRAVLSAMIDTAGADAVMPLRAQIEALADRLEQSMRKAFAAHVRERRYAAALAVGERMIALIPERRVAEEFRRLRPHLERRLAESAVTRHAE